MNLRVPGPTECPPEVLQAGARQMINHRGPEFAELSGRILRRLKGFFQTTNEVLILTTSGTGALESAIVNMLSPGDPVVSISIGVFGDRFATDALRANPDAVALLLTHNETSTGVTNPIAELATAIRAERPGILTLVDAISSLSSIDLPVDALDLDVVVTGSQKGWMVPPGLAMASVSARAWEVSARAKTPRFYFDYGRHRDAQAKGQTPWTPAVSLYFQLDVALEMMEREGRQAIFARHARLADRVRAGVKALGLELFADERYASNTVTAVKVPEGVDGPALGRRLREEHGTVVAGGQGTLQGKIIRIGHLGFVTDQAIDATLQALGAVLPQAGFVHSR